MCCKPHLRNWCTGHLDRRRAPWRRSLRERQLGRWRQGCSQGGLPHFNRRRLPGRCRGQRCNRCLLLWAGRSQRLCLRHRSCCCCSQCCWWHALLHCWRGRGPCQPSSRELRRNLGSRRQQQRRDGRRWLSGRRRSCHGRQDGRGGVCLRQGCRRRGRESYPLLLLHGSGIASGSWGRGWRNQGREHGPIHDLDHPIAGQQVGQHNGGVAHRQCTACAGTAGHRISSCRIRSLMAAKACSVWRL